MGRYSVRVSKDFKMGSHIVTAFKEFEMLWKTPTGKFSVIRKPVFEGRPLWVGHCGRQGQSWGEAR